MFVGSHPAPRLHKAAATPGGPRPTDLPLGRNRTRRRLKSRRIQLPSQQRQPRPMRVFQHERRQCARGASSLSRVQLRRRPYRRNHRQLTQHWAGAVACFCHRGASLFPFVPPPIWAFRPVPPGRCPRVRFLLPGRRGPAGATTDFAMIAGGGLDIPISRHIAIRPIEADHLLTRLPNGGNNVENNLRLSAGLVIRIR